METFRGHGQGQPDGVGVLVHDSMVRLGGGYGAL
jgi:hypothetical protein